MWLNVYLVYSKTKIFEKKFTMDLFLNIVLRVNRDLRIEFCLMRLFHKTTHTAKQVMELWLIENDHKVRDERLEATIFLVGSERLNKQRVLGRG